MDIKLIPVGSGSRFTFPALPEKIQGKYGAGLDVVFFSPRIPRLSNILRIFAVGKRPCMAVPLHFG